MAAGENLKITLIQSDIYWHNVEANLAMLEEKIWYAAAEADLIILPEMFNTGFTMEVKGLAEPMNSKTFRWMKQLASQTGSVLTGSFIVKEGRAAIYYNRLLWMEPDGNHAWYDKRHLFRMASEHETFSPGNELLIKELKGWKICPLVCYDLRFPVWSRNFGDNQQDYKYDLLIYVANWPQIRVNAWNTLLRARAIENLCYVAGVNRVGTDGNDMEYNGKSVVVEPKGNDLFCAENNEIIHTEILDAAYLRSYREKFPAHMDADLFTLHTRNSSGQ